MDKELTIDCQHCGAKLPPSHFAPGVITKCPRCLWRQQVEFFPAFYRKPAPVQTGQALLEDGEASCFYHAQKKAVVACESCGRFLCALCEVEFAGQRLCPACIEAGKTRKKIRNLETHRVLYDDIALSLAILPLLAYPITLVTGPISLYYAIRYWKAPLSIIPRSRLRFVLAALIALVEVAAWIFVLVMWIFFNKGN